MTNVVRIEPNTLAVFFSMDVDPGFYVKFCNDASLFNTVHAGMWLADATEQSRADASRVVEVLRERGTMDFEDGWITLKIGMADAVTFLMEKVGEFKRDEQYSDRQRFEELKRREAAEEKYELLRQAFATALGDKAPDVVALAAA